MATELRRRMIEDMQLRSLSERTQESYVRSVSQLAKHYHKSPDKITEEELRQYFLFLKNDKKYARATCTIALCGIKFFFDHTIKREWPTLSFVRPKKAREPRIVMCRSRNGRLRSCASSGKHTVTRSGSSRLPAGAGSEDQRRSPQALYPNPPYKSPLKMRLKRLGFIRRPRCIPCGTPTPLISLSKGSTSG